MQALFSSPLQQKIDAIKSSWQPLKLGSIEIANPFGLAPMSAITTAPFRLLMEQLGAGFTVSELISCHGITHGNEKTRKMLSIDRREKNVGIQLFGDECEAMAKAAQVAEEFSPKFIDINMGCPVRKVVTKGSGSALMKEPMKAAEMFAAMKKAMKVPLTIKIRTGWDEQNRNAKEIIHIAREEGVEWVAVHGRTRTQQYKGKADWDFLNYLASESPLPLLGNGDLNSEQKVKETFKSSPCHALLLGRGPLRDPFLFLRAMDTNNQFSFSAADYWEVINVYHQLLESYARNEREIIIQLKKHIVWMSGGLENVAQFRQLIFSLHSVQEIMQASQNFFLNLGTVDLKDLSEDNDFMAGGHG